VVVKKLLCFRCEIGLKAGTLNGQEGIRAFI
jgi:hypothetical protein